MPRFRIHDQQTGQTLLVEGDAPPTDQDAAELFEAHYAGQRAPIAEGVSTALAAVGIPAPVTRALLTQGGGVGDAAARIAPPIVGQIVGARVAGVPGMALGGAVGGAAGEALAQGREFLRGERNEPSLGQGAAAVVASAIPLPALRFTGPAGETARQRATKVLGQAVAQRAIQGGGINLVAEGTRQAIDEEQVDWGNLALAFGLGAGIGGALGGVEGALLPRQVLARIRRTPEFRDFEGTDEELIAAVRRRMAGPPPVVDAPPEIPAAIPTPEAPPAAPAPAAGGPVESVEDILGLARRPAPPPSITPDLPPTAAPSAPVATAMTPSGSLDILPAANPPAGAEGTPAAAVEPPAAPAPMAADYQDFKARYLAAFERMNAYTPEQVGAAEYAAQMAKLADAHPDWAAAVEAELDLPATPPELQPPAPQPAAPAAPTGAAAPEVNPAPRAGQEGAPGNGGEAQPASEKKVGKKSITHASQELATAWVRAHPRLLNVAMAPLPDGQWRVTFDTKGSRRRIEASPTGVADILDWIQDVGGVPGPKRGSTGGEYNEFTDLFSGKYRALVRADRGGLDTWIQQLEGTEWEHLANDVEGFKAEVRNAIRQRERVGGQIKAQEVEAKFMTAALDPNKGRGPKEPRGLDQQPTDTLKTGDRGEIKKRDFTVDYVDPEGVVTLKDGPEVPPLKIPPGTVVHFDKDSFRPAPEEQGMDFLPPEEAAPDVAATTMPEAQPPSAPVKSDLFDGGETGGDTTFNLAGEQQDEAKSALELADEAEEAAKARAEQEKRQQRIFDEDAGRINPALLIPLARAALGGALGALEGDTPEERMAYAFAGALGLSVLGSRRLASRVKAKLTPQAPAARPKYAFDPGAPMVLLDPATGIPVGRGQLGALEHVRPIEMPELVHLARQLSQRDIELRAFPRAKGMFKHQGGEFWIALDRRIFRDPIDAQRTLAHEIGHLNDYLDDQTMDRGNILGRIATLREYLAKTLPDTPFNPNGALLPKERAKIRRQAEAEIVKSLGARPPKDEEADRAAWNAAVAERYRELIDEEIDRRGLIREEEARAELIELTEWWRPYDRDKVPESYIAYRESSRELYADALSVMLNAPDELRQRAPIFWKSFTAYFDRKPEAKQTLQDLWTYLHQGQRAVIAAREARLKAGFATAEEFLINHARERELDRSTLRGIIDATKQEWWNIYHPIVARAQQAKAAGARLKWHEDPEMFFDAHPLAENDSYLWLERLNRTIFQPLESTGLTRDDLGLYLFHNRVLNEAYTPANQEETGRSLIANPQGITPLQSRVHLMNMRLAFGAERMQVLEAHARQLQESFFELVRDGHAAGVFTDAQLALARDNRTAYAPFAVVDYLADSDHVPAGMKRQLGTLKDTANPALVFALKGLALQKLAQYNRAKTVAVDLLRDYFGSEIEAARVSLVPQVGGGVKRVPGPAPRGMETITVLRKGVPEYWHVQPGIARMFDDQMPANAMVTTRVLNYVFRNFLHHAFITYNPGFVYATNPVADNLRSYFALPPGVKRRQWIAEQRRAWDMGREHVTQSRLAADMPRRRALRALRKRRPLTPAERKEMENLDAKAFALELLGVRAIASPYDNFMAHAGDQTGMWARMLQDYSLIPDEPGRLREWLEKRAPLLVKLAKRIERDGLISEVMPKGAAYRAMVQGQKWQRKEAAAYVRNHIGTPNIYKRGSRGVINGTIFPYMNVFLRGLEADAVAGMGKAPGPASAKRKASEFWYRMAQAILAPGFMQALAAAGMLGAGLKEIYDAIPEYDKTNYLIVPLGKSLTTRAEDYKAHYLRIRIPETARLLNAMMFHAVNRAANEDPAAAHSLSNLFAFGAGQVPGVHPLLTLGSNWTAFASGYTPVDWHRGQPVVSAADWKAGGWDRLQGMIGYTWDEMGLGGFVRWDPRSENIMEFTASATPVLNRLIRSSDAGLRERNLRADKLTEETYYKIRATMPEHVNRLLQEYNSLQRMGERRNIDQEVRYRELGLWHSKTWAPQLEIMRDAKPAEWKAMAAGLGIDSEPFVRRSRE